MSSSLDLTKIRTFVRLTRLKKDAEAQAKKLGAEIAKIAEDVEMELALAQVRNCPVEVDGLEATVYVWSQVQPILKDGVDRVQVAEALKAHGVEIVQETYNANTFGSYVRELDGEIPEWLAELVDTKTVSKARMRA